MKYKQKFTYHEFAQETIKDIARKRQLEKEGQRQALEHCMRNRDRIQKRISYGRY